MLMTLYYNKGYYVNICWSLIRMSKKCIDLDNETNGNLKQIQKTPIAIGGSSSTQNATFPSKNDSTRNEAIII